MSKEKRTNLLSLNSAEGLNTGFVVVVVVL